LQRPQLFQEKIKRQVATWQFFTFFWQHPDFIVYVACPGDDADKFLLTLYKNFFLQAFLKKKLTLDNFFDEKNIYKVP
jgi:hypothetical protein